jgi:hypothetical protein
MGTTILKDSWDDWIWIQIRGPVRLPRGGVNAAPTGPGASELLAATTAGAGLAGPHPPSLAVDDVLTRG